MLKLNLFKKLNFFNYSSFFSGILTENVRNNLVSLSVNLPKSGCSIKSSAKAPNKLHKLSILHNVNLKQFASKLDLEQKLNQKLKIDSLEVTDLSGNCGSSFLIKIKSPEFNGKTTIAQHRIVNEILKEELKEIHALQLKTEASNK